MAQYDVDLREYFRIIRKRKGVIILMTIFVGLCSMVFSKIKEPVPLYRATAAIKIEQKANMAGMLSGGFWNLQESMTTHGYTITSFPVLKKTAEMMGRIPKAAPDGEINRNRKYLGEIARLKSMIKTEVEERTNIINLTVTARTPDEAEKVANTIARAYRQYNIDSNSKRISEIRTFIEKQLEVTLARLKTAEKDLQDYTEKNGLVSIGEKNRELLRRISKVRDEYQKAREDRSRAEGKLKLFTSGRISGIPDLSAKQLLFSEKNSSLNRSRSQLESLLLQRQRLLSMYTEKHPSVVAVENQIKMITRDTQSDLRLMAKTLAGNEEKLKTRISSLEGELNGLPKKTQELSRLTRAVDLQDKLYTELEKKHQEALIQESGKMENVTLVRPALAPVRPFNIPSNWAIIISGLILGLIIGIVFAFGVEMFDTSMGTIEDVEASLNVPVLGVIPQLDMEGPGQKTEQKINGDMRSQGLITHYAPTSLASEAFRSLRTNLQFIRLEKKSKSFLVTSTFVQEGKSINAVNLALSLAQTGEKVLLIDADLRRASVYKRFGLSREPGLTDYVLGNYEWRDVVNTITDVMLGDFEMDDILNSPGLDNLHIINAGIKPPNPTEILNSKRFRNLLTEAYNEYSYILVDSPPVLPVADPSEIAPYMDGVIMVYMVGRIGRGVLSRAKSTLDNIEANVVGVILNNVKPNVGPDYFRYHTHYYYGDRAREQAKKEPEKEIQKVLSQYVFEHRFGVFVFISSLILLIIGLYLTF
ncbi:MAG: AAA family ATPase [Deltaproteobacteria bacterium]|nr:AAA family ATPase [Deltaproteobacteria bacterium]